MRWIEGVQKITALGATKAVEAGCGKVLAGLVKKIEGDKLPVFSMNSMEELKAFEATFDTRGDKMFDLKQKRIVVTGSSRGIGAGLAKEFAKLGARVAVTYSSNPTSAEKVLSELTGDGHMLVSLNVADASSVEKAFEEVLGKFGGNDGLVNNAGITKDQLIMRMKDEDFDQVIATNLRGAYLCTKA